MEYSCNYTNYYIPLHEILHDSSNDYINLQNLEVHDIMACNLKVITCYYMHYQPLHAPQDANVPGIYPVYPGIYLEYQIGSSS